MKKISITLLVTFIIQLLSVGYVSFANNVVTYTDFEDSGVFGLGKVGSIVSSGDDAHGSVMKIAPNIAEDGWFYAQHDTKLDLDNSGYSQYVVSFDFNAKQTDHLFRFMIRGDEGYKWDKEYGDFAQIYWDEFGNIVFPMNNNNFFTTNETYTGGSVYYRKYEADKWYNIMLVVDTAERWVSLYVDGECVVEKSTDTTHGKLFRAKHIFLGVQKGINNDSTLKDQLMPADGSEALLIDNFKIAYNDANSGLEVTQKGDLYTNGTEINLEASEIITQDSYSAFDNLILINTETGEEINLGKARVDKSNITIPLNKELADNTDYMIKLPEEIKTVTGKQLKSRFVYVQAIAAASEGINTVLAEADFNDGTLNGKNITFEKDVNSAGIELKAVNKNGVAEFTSERFSVWNKWPVIKFNITGDSAEVSDKVITSFDVELKQEDSFAFRLCMYDTDGNEMTSEVFNAQNYFVSLPYRGAPNSSACLDAESSTKYINLSAERFAKDKVYNVRYEYDRATKIMSIYFNNKKVCDGTALATTSGLVGSIRFGLISAHSGQGGFGSAAGNIINIDNIKVGYPQVASKKIKGFRIINEDGLKNGAMSDTALSNAAGGELYLSAKIDMADATADNIRIYSQNHEADITVTEYNEAENIVRFKFNEYLNKGEQYKVEVSNINSEEGGKLADYSAYFTVSNKSSFEIADFKLVNSSGAEVVQASDVSENDNLYISVSFKNTTDNDATVIPYLAVYNDHKLSGLYRNKIVAGANTRLDFSEGSADKILVDNISNADMRVVSFITDAEGNLLTDIVKFGNEGEFVSDDYTLEIEIEAETEGLNLIEVMTENESYAEATELVFADFVPTENSKINTAFKMNKDVATGFYTIYVNGVKSGEKLYKNPTAASSVISSLNLAAKDEIAEAVTKTEKILREDYLDLGIDYDFYDKVDKVKLAELLYNSIKESRLDEVNIKKAVAQIDQNVIIQAISDGLIDNFLDYDESLGLVDSRIGEFIDESFCNEEFGQAVTEKLQGEIYKNTKSFYNKLYEEFVLQTVYRYNGIDNIKQVVEEFSDEIGLDNVPDSSAYKSIAGKLYNSYSALCKAIETAAETKPSKPQSGGGGGGGGAYSSGTIAEKNEEKEDNKEDEAEDVLPQDIFVDLADYDWARNSIVYLAEMGIINGKEADKFYPADNITREELVKILVEAFAEDAQVVGINFEDADINEWYYPYLQKAKGANIANGYSETEFGVGDFVTREDMALLVYNAAKYKNIIIPQVKSPLFFDDTEISDYAKDAIYCLYGNKVINGTGDGFFEPKGNATRAEAAKIVYSCLTY